MVNQINVSPARIERKRMYYDEVIRLYFSEHQRMCEIAQKFSLKRCTVEFWLRTFAEEQAISAKMDEQKVQEQATDHKDKDSQDEVLYLRKRLIQAELRADALDEMINVAEDRYKISIRKKPGAKQ